MTKTTKQTMKRKYEKPAMTVVEIEPQQMICSSTYSRKDADADKYGYTGEFE